MTNHSRPRLMAGALIAAGALALAGGATAQQELDEAELFFELNDTDGDLGIHSLIDGDDWRRLRIEDPGGRVILDVSARGRLGKHGLTELSFESAEPTFDELPAAEIFARFPEGTYEIAARTLDGGKLESEVDLSHVLPAPAGNVEISGVAAPENCDAALPTIPSPIVISWDAVMTSHPTLGEAGPVSIESYELIVELLDTDQEAGVVLPPDVTSFPVADAFLALAEGDVKFEILARDENGNRTAVESCFTLE
ncbi:MAG TPA: hypothetical protein VFT98_17595 [Myxococcota bacterium]|nr:hypothetical protein [Myxococcota bacterium]